MLSFKVYECSAFFLIPFYLLQSFHDSVAISQHV